MKSAIRFDATLVVVQLLEGPGVKDWIDRNHPMKSGGAPIWNYGHGRWHVF